MHEKAGLLQQKKRILREVTCRRRRTGNLLFLAEK